MDYKTMWESLKAQVLKWLSDPDNTRERDSAYEDVDLLMMRLEVKEIEKMRKRNTRAASWIKTSERLPEQKKRVLISNGKSCDIGQLHEDWLDNTLRRFWSVEGAENLGEDLITYWMPLPETPEVEE